jgi:hypothetical protein
MSVCPPTGRPPPAGQTWPADRRRADHTGDAAHDSVPEEENGSPPTRRRAVVATARAPWSARLGAASAPHGPPVPPPDG